MTIAIGQHTLASAGSFNNVTTLTTSAITTSVSGSVFAIVVSSNGGAVSSVLDSFSNLYTLQETGSQYGAFVSIYTVDGGTGGAGHTGTVNCASTNIDIALEEITGAANPSFDAGGSGSNFTGTTSQTGASVTTSNANDLVLSAIGSPTSGNAVTDSGAGFSVLDNYYASAAIGLTTSYAVVSSTGTYQDTYGCSSAFGYSFWAAVAFKAASGGGVSGSAAITEGADTVSASGTTTILGSAAITEGADTVAASGTTTVVGSAAITEGTDTVTASGTTTIVANAAITEGADTVTASGAVGGGVAAILEGADTVNASGTTTIVASAAIVEGTDTASASGTTTIVGTAAITEGSDTVTASGAVGSVTGTAAITEGGDIVTASGSGGAAQGAGKHRKRYGVMDGPWLKLFNTKADADAYRASLRPAPKQAKKAKALKVAAQTINLPELRQELPAPLATKLEQMIRDRQYTQIDELHSEHEAEKLRDIIAQERQEREEIETVTHVIHAHRQAHLEHIHTIHQALRLLHEIRRLRSIQ